MTSVFADYETVTMMSEHAPEFGDLSDPGKRDNSDDMKLAVLEIVVDLILLCGVIASAHAPLV